jgi:hemerythrin-like domain-containing protein
MNCTKALMADHEIILRALQVLDVMTSEMKRGNDVSKFDIDSLLAFLRDFADGCHHVKEEAIFLPALMQAGMGLQDGPLQVMTYEHERGRALTTAMRDAIERNKKEDFVLYASRYVQLLMEHIEKENDVLFERADQILTEDDDQNIVESFTHFEKTTVGQQAYARQLRIIDTLASKYIGAAVL